jgi:hypothetical protein
MGKARVARQETKVPEVIVIGDTKVSLPVELPIDVFGPLKNLDVDLALLMRQAITSATGNGDQAKEAQSLVIDLLVANPNLPRDLIDAIAESATRLLGQEGYDALVAFRPSREDLGVLAKTLLGHYGVSLGEALGSSDSSTNDGTTSKPTSNGGTESTPEGSSETPATPTS